MPKDKQKRFDAAQKNLERIQEKVGLRKEPDGPRIISSSGKWRPSHMPQQVSRGKPLVKAGFLFLRRFEAVKVGEQANTPQNGAKGCFQDAL